MKKLLRILAYIGAVLILASVAYCVWIVIERPPPGIDDRNMIR
jgi:hypothetical protein